MTFPEKRVDGQLPQLRQRLVELSAPTPNRPVADRAVAWLRMLRKTIATAELPEAKVELVHAIYERISVKAPRS